MRRALLIFMTASALSLSACGKGDEGATKVQMKDMEVVDGTATDAMTDLDGVQSEGGAVSAIADNASNSAAPAVKPAEKAPAAEAEILSDQ